MSDYHLAYQIVVGLLRKGDDVLLVRQQGPEDVVPNWALPGGAVEQGELLTGALAREVREETGLSVVNLGPLLYSLQHVNANTNEAVVVFVFEVSQWEGELQSADPQQVVMEARFMSTAEALDKLQQQLPWRVMREPLLAHLRGEAQPGAVWLYRRLEGHADDELVLSIGGHAADGLQPPKRGKQTKPKTGTASKSRRKE